MKVFCLTIGLFFLLGVLPEARLDQVIKHHKLRRSRSTQKRLKLSARARHGFRHGSRHHKLTRQVGFFARAQASVYYALEDPITRTCPLDYQVLRDVGQCSGGLTFQAAACPLCRKVGDNRCAETFTVDADTTVGYNGWAYSTGPNSQPCNGSPQGWGYDNCILSRISSGDLSLSYSPCVGTDPPDSVVVNQIRVCVGTSPLSSPWPASCPACSSYTTSGVCPTPSCSWNGVACEANEAPTPAPSTDSSLAELTQNTVDNLRNATAVAEQKLSNAETEEDLSRTFVLSSGDTLNMLKHLTDVVAKMKEHVAKLEESEKLCRKQVDDIKDSDAQSKEAAQEAAAAPMVF